MFKWTFAIWIVVFFCSFKQSNEINYKIEGNPTCFEKGQKYSLFVELSKENKEQHIIISGVGVVLTKLEGMGMGMYQLHIPAKSQKMAIHFSIQNTRTKKRKIVKSIQLMSCDEQHKER